MSFVFKADGKEVDFDDVDAGVFAKIEKEVDEVGQWTDVFFSPTKNLAAGSLLYQRLAEIAGVEVPNPITMGTLRNAFVLKDWPRCGECEQDLAVPFKFCPSCGTKQAEGRKSENPSETGAGS